MNIVVVNGSPRAIGRTGVLAKQLVDVFNFSLVDLALGELPLYNGEAEQKELDVVKSIRNTLIQADGIVLCTPEYNNAMSGALKNLIELFGSEPFKKKPIALLAVAGGGKGGINALNNARTVVRGVYGNAIPKHLVLDPVDFIENDISVKEDAFTKVTEVIDELKEYVQKEILYKEFLESKSF
ncbi:NADPH-dependent FMN reductase [Gottfriedia solisilvae]|uniref:NADPH-dependent FMN reductase n=1 Tax=Gottfriedia solisilvae TaxID=1516104 RepID=A0A8J3AM72_9BACI|nr:NADPH-dependent FMN reductase [Gottfriedia solisilvae]GGI13241.1 NADPH-dependent FMN reductase [Gottfriedia solisilvae]